MGFGSNDDDNDVVVFDGDGDGHLSDCNNGGKSFGSVSCTICLELVTDNGDRSWAKLQCGHQFHLDCIGSAFNKKRAMQCPNCRKIEKGQWLYANGCRSFSEFSMDDWTNDEDLYDLSYSDMSFGVHWCPFGSRSQLPSSFEEGEFSSSAYHDRLGQNAVLAEHTAVSSGTHPCPYIAYFGPIHPSSSSASGSVSDNANFNNPWSGPLVHSDMSTSHTFPTMDLHYPNWEQHSSPFSTSSSRIAGFDQSSMPPITQRSARTSSEIPRSGSFLHPFLVGHSARAESSVPSSMIPSYPGSDAQACDRLQALQAYYQQQQPGNSPAMHTPVIPGARRFSSHGGISHAGPVPSSLYQSGGFYFFPPGTSGRNFPEPENPPSSRFYAGERDHLPSFSLSYLDRDSSWDAFHHLAGASDRGLRPSNLHSRHRSERTLSQNHS